VLSEEDADELHGLIAVETDRLTRLVTSLLDMTRIDAGVLEVRPVDTPVRQLLVDAVTPLRSSLGDRRVDIDLGPDRPTWTSTSSSSVRSWRTSSTTPTVMRRREPIVVAARRRVTGWSCR